MKVITLTVRWLFASTLLLLARSTRRSMSSPAADVDSDSGLVAAATAWCWRVGCCRCRGKGAATSSSWSGGGEHQCLGAAALLVAHRHDDLCLSHCISTERCRSGVSCLLFSPNPFSCFPSTHYTYWVKAIFRRLTKDGQKSSYSRLR